MLTGGDEASLAPNTVFPVSSTATPQETMVVRPNTDTLYSQVFYDVSNSDLEITVPAVNPTRYFSVAFYDL
jgi:hypothetical protein